MKKTVFVFAIFTFLFSAFSQTNSVSTKANSVSKSSSKTTVKSKVTEQSDLDPLSDYLAKSGTSVNASAWSHNGEYFAVSWNNTTILFESATNTIAAIYSNSADDKLNPFTDITKLLFAPDDSSLLSVHNNGTAMIHSIGNSGSVLITGTGKPIAGAVYAESAERIIISLDEKSLYESTRQTGGKKFNLEKKISFGKKIVSISSDEKNGNIFVTFEDGSVNLVDTKNWKTLSNMKTFVQNKVYPQFASDGNHFLSAQSKNIIFISSIKNSNEKHTIGEKTEFANAAVFSPDGKNIVAATKSGFVRIYEISTGKVLYEFKLAKNDTAKTLSVSPDGEFVLIGTAKGYIYRWSLHKYEFNKDEKKYQNEKGDEYKPQQEAAPTTQKQEPTNESSKESPKNSLNFMFDYSTMPKYYYGNFGIDANYRNYKYYPLYLGGGLKAGMAIPNESFPYTYTYQGKTLNNPFAYAFIATFDGGIAWYNSKIDLLLFSEIGLGGALRFLFNNEKDASYRGKFYFCGVAEASFGIQYEWLRASLGMIYDTNLGAVFQAEVGYSLRFQKKNLKKIQNKKSEKKAGGL